MKSYARKKRLALLLWALALSSVLGFILTRVKKPATSQEQCLEQNNLFDVSLKKLASGCSNEKNTTIYAHFIKQTMNDALSVEDVVNNQSGEISCSPGPYPISHAVDQNNKWQFSETPDYFVWHLNTDLTDHNFYMTNQNGFPIKSEVIQLRTQNKQESTLVLLPMAGLDKGSTYYLYLTLNENNESQTWIQPLIIDSKVEE